MRKKICITNLKIHLILIKKESKRNWWLRLSFIVLSIVGLGLTLFSFVTQNLIFGVIFAILTVIFIVGTFLVKTKRN